MAQRAYIAAVADAAEIDAAIVEAEAALEALRQEYQVALNTGESFTDSLALVTETLPSLTYFTSIEMDTTKVYIEGTVDNPYIILSYIAALNANQVTEARIVEISEWTDDEGLTSIYFAIEVTR